MSVPRVSITKSHFTTQRSIMLYNMSLQYMKIFFHSVYKLSCERVRNIYGKTTFFVKEFWQLC